MDKAQQDAMKKEAGIEAAKLVKSGMIVGLGTGSTVRFLVDELGRRKQEEGLEFTGVTTSRRTQEQAEGYGIKIVNIDDVDHIDLCIDGADEVDKNFNGIKGGGAADIQFLPVLFGVIAAAVSGYIAIKVMLALVKKANFKWFSLYLVCLSILLFILQI